jgi:hypothetical protein
MKSTSRFRELEGNWNRGREGEIQGIERSVEKEADRVEDPENPRRPHEPERIWELEGDPTVWRSDFPVGRRRQNQSTWNREVDLRETREIQRPIGGPILCESLVDGAVSTPVAWDAIPSGF